MDEELPKIVEELPKMNKMVANTKLGLSKDFTNLCFSYN